MRILLAEDDPHVRSELKELLNGEHYTVITAVDGIDAFEKFRADSEIELLLLDIRMPRCTGLQTLEAIRQTEEARTRIFEAIFITGNNDNESVVKALKLDAFAFLFKPLQVDKLFKELEAARETVNGRRYRQIQETALRNQVEEKSHLINRLTAELTDGFASAVELIALSAEYYIPGIELHIRRVGEMAACLATRLGFSAEDAQFLRLAAMLHDVGKIEGPRELYNAERALTDDEFERTKEHTLLGRDFLRRSTDPFFEMAATICEQHHERADGTGYPRGLKQEQIALEAAIVHVADVYDNLRAPRPYRRGLAHARSIDIMVNGDEKSSPAHFNAAVLQALLYRHRDIEAIFDRYAPPN
jgi:putative two-component system response regulator